MNFPLNQLLDALAQGLSEALLGDALGGNESIIELDKERLLIRQAWTLIDRNGPDAVCDCGEKDCPVTRKIKELLGNPEEMEKHRQEQQAADARKIKAAELLQLAYDIMPEFVVSPKGGRYVSGLIATGVLSGLGHAVKDEEVVDHLTKIIARAIGRSNLASEIGRSLSNALKADQERKRDRMWDRRFGRWLDGMIDDTDSWIEGFINAADYNPRIADSLAETGTVFNREQADRVAESRLSRQIYPGWLFRSRLTGYRHLKMLLDELAGEKEAERMRLAELIETAYPAVTNWLKEQETPADRDLLAQLDGDVLLQLKTDVSRSLMQEALLRYYGVNMDDDAVPYWVLGIKEDISANVELDMVNDLLREGKLLLDETGVYSWSQEEAARILAEDEEAAKIRAADQNARTAQEEAVMLKLVTGKELNHEEWQVYSNIPDDSLIINSLIVQGRLVHDEGTDLYTVPGAAE